MRRAAFKKTGGYFSVEASMIIPLVIFLFSFLLYLTFYLYNRCVVSQDVYLLAFRGSLCCGSSPDEAEKYVTEQTPEQFGRKYIGIKSLIGTVDADRKWVEVQAEGIMSPSFTQPLLPQSMWHFQAKSKAERICPAECIRKVRLAKKIAESMSKGESMNKGGKHE